MPSYPYEGNTMIINDGEFINQFENLSLDHKQFNHIGHLRISWLYLNNYKLEIAIDKVTSGISNYACSLGASDKFHHTLTEAVVRIMALRLKEYKKVSFSDFIAVNKDLVEELPSLIGRHYSCNVLNSDEARVNFVKPDLEPLYQLGG